MKIRMVLSLPIPRGPGASLLHCLPSCFCVSLCHFCSRFPPPLAPSCSLSLSLYLFHFFLHFFLLSLATHELFCGFLLEDLSGAISPQVNKCCDRRQVGRNARARLEERNTLEFLLQQGPEAYFPLCLSLSVCVCICHCVCVSLFVSHSQMAGC